MKGLIRPFEGLIRPFKGLIRPLKGPHKTPWAELILRRLQGVPRSCGPGSEPGKNESMGNNLKSENYDLLVIVSPSVVTN